REVRLTRTEYAILKLLLQNPEQVMAKSVLLDRIGADTPDCTESSLKMHVSNLRRKLREAGGRDFALYGVGSAAAITAQLERGNLAAIAAWSDYAAGYLAVRRAVNAVRGTGGALGPLPFFILREEDIYAPENQKLLFPIMSSSSR
uniref:winged helix-turn-helix domain-containing protein n=1 Tax=uncultured Oscillibacter sp. TaxID=876091 RepID=UPI0026220804